MNHIKKITLFLLAFALISMSAFCLVACNKHEDEKGDVVRDLYIYTIEFEQDDLKDEQGQSAAENGVAPSDKIATVFLTFSKTDRQLTGQSAVWHSDKRKDGEFYFVTTSTISFNPESIFCAVKESIPQEDLVKDEVEYNRLKVVLRYDTIYKSIRSDGEITRNGRTYTHLFAIDESKNSEILTLEMRSANSANWYAVLVAAALGVALIAIVATLAVKGAKWQKTKTKE